MRLSVLYSFLVFITLAACHTQPRSAAPVSDLFVVVLGTAQDAGYPQAGCRKQCCQYHYEGVLPAQKVVCLGIVDRQAGKAWMLEATPNFPEQWHRLAELSGSANPAPDGILLTHAHIGHYTGLMHLGREVMGASQVPVFAMPRMAGFLAANGPWSQLIRLQNISIQPLYADSAVRLSERISITPLLVPHRDEYSETVGFSIESPQKRILFIPDIDKWSKWEKSIIEMIAQYDVAFLDATFYRNGEIPRDMSEVPHPFVEESMQLFAEMPADERRKIHFIHFNHTNPLIWSDTERKTVEASGFQVADEGDLVDMNGE